MKKKEKKKVLGIRVESLVFEVVLNYTRVGGVPHDERQTCIATRRATSPVWVRRILGVVAPGFGVGRGFQASVGRLGVDGSIAGRTFLSLLLCMLPYHVF